MILRQAEPSDARQIAEVHVLSWQHAYRGLLPHSFLDGLSVTEREQSWRQALIKVGCQVLVAVEGNRIIGFTSFGASRDDDAAKRTGEIYAIYLRPDMWQQGIGRVLWVQAISRLANKWKCASNGLGSSGQFESAPFLSTKRSIKLASSPELASHRLPYSNPTRHRSPSCLQRCARQLLVPRRFQTSDGSPWRQCGVNDSATTSRSQAFHRLDELPAGSLPSYSDGWPHGAEMPHGLCREDCRLNVEFSYLRWRAIVDVTQTPPEKSKKRPPHGQRCTSKGFSALVDQSR